MKLIKTAVTLTLLCGTAGAATVTDDFNRADTAFVTNNAGIASTIGANWTSAAPATNTTYRIFNNAVDIGNTDTKWQKAMLINTAAGTINAGAGTNFTLSAQLQQNTVASSAFMGLVFNYQDAGNFYLFRMGSTGTVSMIAYSNSVQQTVVFNKAGAFTAVQDRPYTLTVNSSDPYSFDMSIFDTVTSSTVFSTNVTLAASVVKHQDGLGGMFGSSSFVTMDNFSLETTQPTRKLSLFVISN